MKKYWLECCVDSVESAIAAKAGGADRLELCGGLVIGGLSPSICLFEQIKEKVGIPVHVLIRPRFGDFCYTEHEKAIIVDEIHMFVKAGADAIVCGSLLPDGSLDQEHMKQCIQAAQGKPITLHRAFDVCRDPKEVLQQSIKLGIKRILTSGCSDNCLAGATLLRELVEEAGDQLEIMCGGGVSPKNLQQIIDKTGAMAYHMSGKVTVDSAMTFRNDQVHMGLPGLSEYEIWRTLEENIRQAKIILHAQES